MLERPAKSYDARPPKVFARGSDIEKHHVDVTLDLESSGSRRSISEGGVLGEGLEDTVGATGIRLGDPGLSCPSSDGMSWCGDSIVSDRETLGL